MILWTRRAVLALLPLLLIAAIACESDAAGDGPAAAPPAAPATDSSPLPLNTPVLTAPAPTAPLAPEPPVAPAPESSAKVGDSVGDKVPEFTLTLGSGGTISSQELIDQAQPTFIFFFATWCPICRAELTQMKDIYPEFADEVAFYLVGQDTTETLDEIIAYKERQGQTWEVAAPNLQLLRDLKVLSQSTKVAIDHNGVIVYRDGYRGGSPDKWREVFLDLRDGKLSSLDAPAPEPAVAVTKALEPPPQDPAPQAAASEPAPPPAPPQAAPSPVAAAAAPPAKSPPEPTPVPPPTATPPTPPPTATPAPAITARVGNDVGERVPDFTLTLVSGETVTSADLIESGQPTFLFFAATW